MTPGLQRLGPGRLAAHRHAQAYAALVVSGTYIEAGVAGRFRVEPGDVVLHGAFDTHANDIGRRGCEVVNRLLDGLGAATGLYRAAGGAEAWACPDPATVQAAFLRLDWPDDLAEALRRDVTLPIGRWGAQRGLSPSEVSRGFAAAFGMGPARYRAEIRLARALRRIDQGDAFAGVASDCGFADQAHLTRSVVQMTGRRPGDLRRRKSVQDG